MNDELNKLYTALIGKGYTTDDLGDENTFRSMMSDKNNRRDLYDYVSGRGDFRIGDYDAYEQRLTSQPDKAAYTFTSSELGLDREEGLPEVDTPFGYEKPGGDDTPVPYKLGVKPEEKKAFSFTPHKEWTAPETSIEDVFSGAAEKNDYHSLKSRKGITTPRMDVVKHGDKYYTPEGSFSSYLDAAMAVDDAKVYNGVSVGQMKDYYSVDESDREKFAKSIGRSPKEIEGAYSEMNKQELKGQYGSLAERVANLKETQRVEDIKMYDEYRKNRGFGGFVKDAIMGIPAAENDALRGNIPSSELDISPKGIYSKEQNDALTAAGRKLNEVNDIIRAAESGNFVDAMTKALNKADTWTADRLIKDASTIKRVADKYEKEGEESLTKAEKALLEAVVMQVAVANEYEDELTAWDKAGQSLGESVPFMIEMFVNPLSGLGKKTADKLTKLALKKIGEKGAKNFARRLAFKGADAVGRVAGGVVGGTGMAFTTGLPSLEAGVIERTTGDATYGRDIAGDIEYRGHENAEGLGTAIYKETTKKMLDNASEMIGAGYASAPFKWLQKTGKGTRLLGWIDNLAQSKTGKMFGDFMEKTKWNGPIEEFLEEVHVGLLEPALVGDSNLKDFFNGKNLASVAIAVAVPGVTMSAINTAAGVADGAFKVGAQERWKMQNAEAKGYELWQDNPNEWNDLTRSLMVGQLTDIEKTMNDVYNNENLSPEQKKAALEYAVYSLQWRTARGVKDAFAEGKKFIDPMLYDVYGTAYAEVVSPKRADRAYKELVATEERAKKMLGVTEGSIDEFIGERSAEEVARGNKDVAGAITAYQAAKLNFEGLRDRFQADKERAYRESDKSIDDTANNGTVFSTELEGEHVFITSGDVVLNENGTVDYDNSSDILYIMMPDGKKKPVSASVLPGKVQAENAEALKAAKRAEIDAVWKAEFDAAEQEAVQASQEEVQQPANTFTFTEDGERHTVEFVADNGDGLTSTVKVDGKETSVTNEMLANWRGKVQTENAVNDAIQASVELPEVPDFFRLDGKNYSVVSRNKDGSVTVTADGKRVTLPAGTDYSTIMPTDKKGAVQFTELPVERTHEYFVQKVKNDKARAYMIEENRKEAEAALKKFDKEPAWGKDPDAYEAVMTKWEADKKAARAKVDYWNEVAKLEAEITSSEMKNIAENLQPKEVVEMTADEFVANNMPKITPESFKRETGLGGAEQKELVGIIAGEDKGGMSVEQAAEYLIENYDSELRGLGFNGDVQDMRNMIIDILSNGNPRSYAKQGLEQRKQESVEQQRAELEAVADQLGFETIEGLIEYEVSVMPRIISDHNGFDETEYYNNLAENYEYDTTRESESAGRGGELLQGEQSTNINGVADSGTGNERGAVSGDVQGGGQNGAPQEEAINEPVGNSEQLSSSEIPNNQSVTEGGNAPGQSGVAKAELQDARAFAEAYSLNTVEAYLAYLGRFPEGAYRDGARNGIRTLEGTKEANSEAIERAMDVIAQAPSGVYADNQGNPVDADGKLVVEEVASIDEITDEDFENPTRNVLLPAVPENVATAIGTQGRPVVIKKNVFEKNSNTHVELEPEDSRNILRSALYNPNLVGSTQPIKRPDYKVAIRTGEQNAVVVLDVYQEKDFVEIVGWRMVNEKGLAKMQRQAEREGGQFLILSPNDGSAAALSALPLGLSSVSEDRNSVSNSQENTQKSGENAENAGEIQEPRSVEETLDNGDKRVTEYNSRGEVETVYIERNGKVVSIDSYDEGVLFEHAEYDDKGRASLVTRYDKSGNVVGTQKYVNGIESKAYVREAMRTAPLRARAEKWMKDTGVPVRLIGVGDEITNSAARRAINAGEKVTGWIDNNEVVLYLPNISNEKEIDDTFVHEVVAHKGLKALMGKDFDALCDKVWEMMSEEQRAHYLDYPGVNGDTRRAADEYMAHLAEGVDLTEADKSVWQRIVEAVREFLAKSGFKLSNGDIENLIRASYSRLRAQSTEYREQSKDAQFRIAEVNERFNNELQQQIDGTLPKGHVYELGMPSEVLKSAGLPNLPIELAASRLSDKSMQENHPFELSEIKGLVEAVQEPLAVFRSATRLGSFVVLTEIQHEGRNYVVAIETNRDKGRIQINSVRSIHYRNSNKHIANWIEEGLLEYADKKRMSEWLSKQQYNSADVRNLFRHSAKLVESFENPSIESENTLFRTTYHGSGAKFDRFDHSFMGTGEGAQAFGWGTYVTEVEGIGRQYARSLAKPRLSYKGEMVDSEEFNNPWRIIKDLYDENHGRLRDMRARAERIGNLVEEDNTEMKELWTEVNRLLGEVRAGDLKIVPGRNLYTVEIPDDNGSNYLHWEEVVPKKVENAVKERLFERLSEGQGEAYKSDLKRELNDVFRFSDYTGRSLYHNLSAYVGGDKAASLFLNDMGFVGISYPANATTGGRADGARNYVIFNENDAQIENHTQFRIVGDAQNRKDSERRQEKKRINDIIDIAAGFVTVGGKKQATKNRLKREADRKELAKEIYSAVLKGDFNDVTLAQIDKFIEDATPLNPFGRRISQRLPQRMERALREGARANAVDALFSRISESAVPANGRFSEAGRRAIEERKKELLKGWAIATGNWHTDLKEFTDDTEPIGEGKDSKVYSSKDGRYVIKASKGKPYGKRFRPDIDNIALFNDVFRNSRYEILGYGEIDGEFVRILQQPVVDFAQSTPLTSEECREYMKSLGFEPLNEANTAFADGEIVIADLQKGNVVKDAAGNISVIDADAKLHTKDVGGDYTYPPVEEDLPKGATLDESEISATPQDSEDGIRFRVFGGNSGYVGYSMSKRAAEARKEGRYPKTDFKKEYGVSGKSFDLLQEAGVIYNSEWHHTSKMGNRTDFFSWDNETDAEYYAANKKRIDKAVNEVEKLKPEYDYGAEVKAIDKYLAEGRSQSEIWNFIEENRRKNETANKAYKDARKSLVEQMKDEFYDFYEQQNAKQTVRELVQPYAKELREERERAERKEDGAKRDDIRFRFIGEKGAANLDRAEEATTRLDNLAVAREMKTAGKDAKAIKLATGWERGADGKWRYETEDAFIKETPMQKIARLEEEYKPIDEEFNRLNIATAAPLRRGASEEEKARRRELNKRRAKVTKEWSKKRGEIYDAERGLHGLTVAKLIGEDNELLKAYPELADMQVSFVNNWTAQGFNGFYDGRSIWINPYAEDANRVFVHEVQHAIQHIEGFAKGGNTETIDVIQDKARVWAWRNALKETEKEHPELAGTTELERVLMDEYRSEGLEKYIPTDEQRMKGFNLYARGYDGEGYEHAFYQMPNVVAGNGYATYKRLAGEVESRNVQERMGMTEEERRNSLARETEDVAREDQIFIYDALGGAMMGSRVDARMAEVAARFDGKQLTAEQRAVVDVFGGKADNLIINVKTKDGNERKVVMRQGNEMGAGAKHSLYRHFGMNNGAITAEDVLLIPEILANGERTEKQRGKKTVIEYKYTDNNGVEYTVLTEIDSRREAFANFYTNRKASSAARKTRSEEARDTADDASEDKGSNNSSNSQGGGTLFSIKDGESSENREQITDNSEPNIPLDEVPTQPMTLMERLTNSLLEVSAKNKENLELRRNALRTFGRDVENLLRLMRAQREYDKSTVDTLMKLAKMYFKYAQLLGEVTPYEVTRIMGVLNRSVGKRDISGEAMQLVDILLDAHTKSLAGILEKAEKVKAKKVNAAGVEVMGSLDKYAQEMTEVYKDAKGWDINLIDESISECENRLAEADDDVREALGLGENDDIDKAVDGYVSRNNSADGAVDAYKYERARLEGFNLARDYREKIHHAKVEISTLKQELKDAETEHRQGLLNGKELKEFRKATQEAIMQAKTEMIEGYHDVIKRFTSDVALGRARAKAFVQEQIDRAKEIQHNANSDMEGHPADAQGEKPDKWNNSAMRWAMSSMPTFQGMLKKFGEKAVDGKGYLYNRYMPQATQAADKEFKGKVAARLTIEAKLKEVFGKKMSIEKFLKMSREKGITITYKEAGMEKYFDLGKGQMLYVYMVNKMSDGKMKLRKMGITDELVEEIAEKLDDRMIKFADWVQDALLGDLREKYNTVHERMFGTPMAAIENYFPIKIRKEARGERGDVGQQYTEDNISTVTGSIIKRSKNSTALDLSADAMSVLIEHIDNMEHWAAFAEFNRDLNSLLNYRHFQNQVKNMTSVRYGSGDVLWRNFKEVASIVAGTYRPSNSEIDKAVLNIAKGLTRAKINFRGYTALKQVLSTPAFWNEAGMEELAKCYANPKGSCMWAMENLPGFAERWKGRTMGNEKLLPNDSDWKIWRTKFVENATNWGMTPNAAIDALTVAQGARAVYLTKLKMFKKAGYTEQRADEKALQAAAEAYNESQQSSEGVYISPLQVSGTIGSAIFSTFKNNNFGYTRKTLQAIANINRKRQKGYKEKTIEFMVKQMVRDGLTEEQAKRFATKLYNKSLYKDVADVALFGVGLNLLWEFGGNAIYLLMGDDEEEKKKLMEEMSIRGEMGVLQGIPGGEMVMGAAFAIKEGNAKMFRLPQLVAVSDVTNVAQALDTDWVKGATDLINMLLAMGVGVNVQTFTDLYAAAMDIEGATPEEIGIFVLRALSAPQTQIEKLRVDDALENSGEHIEEAMRQYIEYKTRKNTPVAEWMYSDEGEQKAWERYSRRFKGLLNERLELVVEDSTAFDLYYNDASPLMKQKLDEMRKDYLSKDKKEERRKADVTIDDVVSNSLYGKNPKNEVYYGMTNSEDIDEDFLLKEEFAKYQKVYTTWNKLRGVEKKEYAKTHKKELDVYKKVKPHINALNDARSDMKTKPNEAADLMTTVRKKRRMAIKLINEYNNE